MLEHKQFYDKVEDQWCYLWALWSIEPPHLFQKFLIFYERQVAREATNEAESQQIWRLRTLEKIEDEMPAMIVKFFNGSERHEVPFRF
jgi:hypothetical protein